MPSPLGIETGPHTDTDPQETEARGEGGLDTLLRELEEGGPDSLELWKKEEGPGELKVPEETVTKHTKSGDKVG